MTDAAPGPPDDSVLGQPGLARLRVPLARAVLAGLRQPIVAILLLIAFSTSISGRVLDGILMLIVAIFLAWDAGKSRLRGEPTRPGMATVASGEPATRRPVPEGRSQRKLVMGLGWLTAGLLYAVVAGTFKRYSWPATACVISLGVLMIAIGWRGPLRQRAALTGQALHRAWLWGVVVVAGGLWELSSLLQQPSLTTDSYAHPTISALTDPLLTSHPGRSLILGIWLLLGWFLAGR